MNGKDIASTLKNGGKAILSGELLLRLNVSRYFIHILWTFVLIGALIWYSLAVDSTLVKVEQNEAMLKELEIECTTKEFELKSLYRRTSIQELLKQKGSLVQEPVKPASIIER